MEVNEIATEECKIFLERASLCQMASPYETQAEDRADSSRQSCFTPSVRRLIVNADDFGFTSGVNQAIVEAHMHGVVTSSTLMAKGPAFARASQLSKTLPRLSVGCHIVLIDGEPVLGAEQLPSLTTRTAAPRFRDGLTTFAARAIADKMNADEINAEAQAQIRKIQAAGIVVSHFDTHKHTHLFPTILRPLLRAAASCGVRAVRNPFGPCLPLLSSQLLTRPNLWMRYAKVRALRCLAGKFREAVDREGFITPDGTLGVVVTGALDESLFRAIARSIPEGTWELVCHPGYNDADLQTSRTRLRESRETELRVLTLPDSRAVLSQEGIELISYHDLVPRPSHGLAGA
jgi:hopanoid biosynthesis associated protein HpnK